MRKTLLIILLLLLNPALVGAQAVLGAREVGIGRAVTALPGSNWAVFGNPAMIPADTGSVSFFGIRYYGFSELTDAAAAVQVPTGIGVLSAGAHRYGFELFNETRVRIGYTRHFGGFRYGLVLNYTHVEQGGGYGSAGAVGMDLGVAARLFGRVWVGGRSTNVNHPTYNNSNEELPREVVVGISYELSDRVVFTTDLVKDVRFPISYRGGVELRFFERVMLRTGVTSNPATFSLGFGYASRRWSVNLAAQNHETLGLSPGIDFSLIW